MSDNNYDPIQPNSKKGFLKNAILGSDEEYEEYLRDTKTTDTVNKVNSTSNLTNDITVNNVAYTKKNPPNEINMNDGNVRNINYDESNNNSAVVLKTNDVFINFILALTCMFIVIFAARLFTPDYSEYSDYSDEEGYSDDYISSEERQEIIDNGGVISNYAYNETIEWTNDDYSNIIISIPTYYGFSKDPNAVSSAAYTPDNRFPGKGRVFDVEIKYTTLNDIALYNYETHLIQEEGFKRVLNDPNKNVFIKSVGDSTYEFVIREYAIFTYGFCIGEYKSVLGLNLTIQE